MSHCCLINMQILCKANGYRWVQRVKGIVTLKLGRFRFLETL